MVIFINLQMLFKHQPVQTIVEVIKFHESVFIMNGISTGNTDHILGSIEMSG